MPNHHRESIAMEEKRFENDAHKDPLMNDIMADLLGVLPPQKQVVQKPVKPKQTWGLPNSDFNHFTYKADKIRTQPLRSLPGYYIADDMFGENSSIKQPVFAAHEREPTSKFSSKEPSYYDRPQR